jgi:hypothetical protein
LVGIGIGWIALVSNILQFTALLLLFKHSCLFVLPLTFVSFLYIFFPNIVSLSLQIAVWENVSCFEVLIVCCTMRTDCSKNKEGHCKNMHNRKKRIKLISSEIFFDLFPK